VSKRHIAWCPSNAEMLLTARQLALETIELYEVNNILWQKIADFSIINMNGIDFHIRFRAANSPGHELSCTNKVRTLGTEQHSERSVH